MATSALVMTSGYAAAEVTFGGSAGFGLQYNEEAPVESTLFSFATLTIAMRGETDGGLTFGADIAIKIEDNGGLSNDDTTVFIEGAFGRVSFGAVGEADEVRGFNDIGWDGLGVDDIAESTVGDELGDIFGQSISHNVNYTYSTDAFSVSLSTQLDEVANGDENGDNVVNPLDEVETYALGGRYNFGDYYVGLGYGAHEFGALDVESDVVSLWAGGSIDAFSFRAMYAVGEHTNGLVTLDTTGFGLSVDYEVSALTLSAMYGQTEFSGAGSSVTQEGYGIGAAYDLGGGASISGGIAVIDDPLGDETEFAPEETRADIGMTFSF